MTSDVALILCLATGLIYLIATGLHAAAASKDRREAVEAVLRSNDALRESYRRASSQALAFSEHEQRRLEIELHELYIRSRAPDDAKPPPFTGPMRIPEDYPEYGDPDAILEPLDSRD